MNRIDKISFHKGKQKNSSSSNFQVPMDNSMSQWAHCPFLSCSSSSYSAFFFYFPPLLLFFLSKAPRAATSLLFRGVTNTSLEITWSSPVDSDFDDFELQWSPRDRLSVINPYYSRTSCSRILKGMYPGRLYIFSLRTVSGATQPGAAPSYSTAIQNSIRTSRRQHFLFGNRVVDECRGNLCFILFFSTTEPERVQSLHCRPQSSTSISCTWVAPEADYDSYTIECLHQDSHTLVYSRRTSRETTTYVITQLEPHKHYAVSVKVISAGTTSEEVQDSVVTMIDRKHSQGDNSLEPVGELNFKTPCCDYTCRSSSAPHHHPGQQWVSICHQVLCLLQLQL